MVGYRVKTVANNLLRYITDYGDTYTVSEAVIDINGDYSFETVKKQVAEVRKAAIDKGMKLDSRIIFKDKDKSVLIEFTNKNCRKE